MADTDYTVGATLELKNLTSFRAGLKSVKGDVAGVGKGIQTLGTKAAAFGKTLTRTVTPAAVAVGAVMLKAFNEWDAGFDALRAGTGLTGKALEDLGGSMKTVAGQVTAPLSQVGEVMADVQQRTGLMGPPLERLTKQLLDLERLGNMASAETVTRVFGDWSIATDKQSGALDALFRASQATGPSVDELGQLIVQYGAPLRQLGFGFEEAAALMGKFEKEGVNTRLTMGGLRIALGKMATEGIRDPAAALVELTRRIEKAESAGEALNIATEYFGSRAGPDMAAAIREGRFAIEDLLKTVTSGPETIEKAAKATEDWGDKLKMLWNRVSGVIGPIGEMGFAVSMLVAGIGPLVTILSGPLVWGIRAVGFALIWLSANPVVVILAAIVALVYLIVDNWGVIKRTTLAVFGAIGRFMEGVWNGILDVIGGALSWILRGLRFWLDFWLNKFVGGILWGAEKAFGWIPFIGGKIKDAKREFDKFVGGVIEGLDRQIERFDAWGESAEGAFGKALEGWKGVQHAFQQGSTPSELRVLMVPADGRARGGRVQAGRPYVVGERGPEPFVPDQSRTVISHEESLHQIEHLGRPITMNMTVNITESRDPKATAELVAQYVSNRLARS